MATTSEPRKRIKQNSSQKVTGVMNAHESGITLNKLNRKYSIEHLSVVFIM